MSTTSQQAFIQYKLAKARVECHRYDDRDAAIVCLYETMRSLAVENGRQETTMSAQTTRLNTQTRKIGQQTAYIDLLETRLEGGTTMEQDNEQDIVQALLSRCMAKEPSAVLAENEAGSE